MSMPIMQLITVTAELVREGDRLVALNGQPHAGLVVAVTRARRSVRVFLADGEELEPDKACPVTVTRRVLSPEERAGERAHDLLATAEEWVGEARRAMIAEARSLAARLARLADIWEAGGKWSRADIFYIAQHVPPVAARVEEWRAARKARTLLNLLVREGKREAV